MSSLVVKRVLYTGTYLIVPAVASGIVLYEIYAKKRLRWQGSRPVPIRSWHEAVDNLCVDYRIADSQRYIETVLSGGGDAACDLAQAISPAERCRLALEGSTSVRYLVPEVRRREGETTDINQLLKKLQLDKVWDVALRWYLVRFCAEEDLHCQQGIQRDVLASKPPSEFGRREQLLKLLRLLLFKSEVGPSDKLLEQGAPSTLLNLTEQMRASYKPVVLMALKILSNLAQGSRAAAEEIAKSEWLPLLASMLKQPKYPEESVLAHKILVNCLHSLEARDYELGSHVYELYHPKGDEVPELDVILIHGLRGSCFRTWRQKDAESLKTGPKGGEGGNGTRTLFWPRDWLPGDVNAPIRVLALDYSTNIMRFGKVLESVVSRSPKFREELHQAGVGQRPVVFICHSMGGLLLKHMLTHDESLLQQTRGILFSAVPHRGSPVASSYSHPLIRPSDDLQLLRVESETNRDLHLSFMQIAKEVPRYVTVLECEMTPFVLSSKPIEMVPEESGFLGLGSVYHVNENHHNTCKPSSRESVFYRVVKNFINDTLWELRLP